MFVTTGVGCTCSLRRSPFPSRAGVPILAAQHSPPCSSRPLSNSSTINTYAKCAANPRGMRTYKIIGLKTSWNEHFRKMGGGEVLLLPSDHHLARKGQQASNHRISSYIRTLYALFCQRAKINSCIFIRARTISWKWGYIPTSLSHFS